MTAVSAVPSVKDIAISGDIISAIGTFDRNEAVMVIDAEGLVVAPGFIDTHAHSDFTILADPRAEGKVSQGVTTEINGNCGMSAAPLFNKAFERREADLKELGITERWNTFKEYFTLLEKRGPPLIWRHSQAMAISGVLSWDMRTGCPQKTIYLRCQLYCRLQ